MKENSKVRCDTAYINHRHHLTHHPHPLPSTPDVPLRIYALDLRPSLALSPQPEHQQNTNMPYSTTAKNVTPTSAGKQLYNPARQEPQIEAPQCRMQDECAMHAKSVVPKQSKEKPPNAASQSRFKRPMHEMEPPPHGENSHNNTLLILFRLPHLPTPHAPGTLRTTPPPHLLRTSR